MRSWFSVFIWFVGLFWGGGGGAISFVFGVSVICSVAFEGNETESV